MEGFIYVWEGEKLTIKSTLMSEEKDNQNEELNEENHNQEEQEETTNEENVEETPQEEPQTFEERLIAFFEEHKPRKLKFVDEIVEKFSDKEEIVMAHLERKYGNRTKQALKDRAVEELPGGVAEEPKPKKGKKKLVLVIVFVIIFGGIGAGAYMFKDQLMGIGEGDAPAKIDPTEETTDEAAATEEPVEETTTEEETPAEEPMAADSTATEAAVDSSAAREKEDSAAAVGATDALDAIQ